MAGWNLACTGRQNTNKESTFHNIATFSHNHRYISSSELVDFKLYFLGPVNQLAHASGHCMGGNMLSVLACDVTVISPLQQLTLNKASVSQELSLFVAGEKNGGS